MHVENNVYYASHVHEYAVLTVVFQVKPLLFNGYKTPLEVIPDILQLYASNFSRTESNIIKKKTVSIKFKGSGWSGNKPN